VSGKYWRQGDKTQVVDDQRLADGWHVHLSSGGNTTSALAYNAAARPCRPRSARFGGIYAGVTVTGSGWWPVHGHVPGRDERTCSRAAPFGADGSALTGGTATR
jgi:hypothetical protein